jgi:hypothetical protein
VDMVGGVGINSSKEFKFHYRLTESNNLKKTAKDLL